MELSRQIAKIAGKGGDGWDFFRRARTVAMNDPSVIELTIGEHDIRTDAAILDEMRRGRAGRSHRLCAPFRGRPSCAGRSPAGFAAHRACATGPENVSSPPGGQAALFAALTACCDPGDRALICDPYYATYPGTVRAAGAVPVAVPHPGAPRLPAAAGGDPGGGRRRPMGRGRWW